MRLTPKTGRLLVTIVVTLGLYFWDPAWLGRLARAVNHIFHLGWIIPPGSDSVQRERLQPAPDGELT
jgi:hypothetical protein